MKIHTLLYVPAVLLAAACASGSTPTEPEASTDRAPNRQCGAAESVATVQARLAGAGVAAGLAGTIRQPFMSVPASRLAAEGADVQLFVYRDARARAADTDALDPARVSPPNTIVSWMMPPSLVADCNVAAIVLTRDEGLRQRIHTAIATR